MPLSLLIMILLAPAAGPGGDPAHSLPLPGLPGQIVERVACASDPSRAYALYLPASYSPERRWPILVLMDPRGRALVPLRLFQERAERRGWILVSSWDTASDGPAEVNVKAMNAILPDAQRRYSFDPRRLYLGGFSGTARAAFEFAGQLEGKVAGVIALGGGLPEGLTLSKAPDFSYFGGAGTRDFNYEEMRALDAALARQGAAHRFREFDGDHSWGPAEVAAEAIDWMEIRAVRSGLRDRDEALVEEISGRWMKEAAALESSGLLHEAAARYGEIAEDLAGLRDMAGVSARAAELGRSKGARRTASLIAKLSSDRRAYESRLQGFLSRFASASPPPRLEESLAELRIRALKARAAGGDGRDEELDALSARRLLALVQVHAGFYVPRDFMDRKDPGRALAILKVAAAIDPEAPGVCLGMARARAQIGQKAEAIQDLRCLAAAPGVQASLIENDPLLAPLREEAGYKEILERLRQASPPPP